MKHLSLFSGIGGSCLAARWAGFETVAMVERDKFCQSVLRKHWENAEIYDDIRNFDGSPYKGIDLLCGGFPCQPFSVAGKSKGVDDDRFLWPEMLRVIGEIKPRWVVGENVQGLLSQNGGRTFGRIIREMAEMGYRVGWACFGAKDVGAFHRRNRTFIVAHSIDVRHRQLSQQEQECGGEFAAIARSDGEVQSSREASGSGVGVRDLPDPEELYGDDCGDQPRSTVSKLGNRNCEERVADPGLFSDVQTRPATLSIGAEVNPRDNAMRGGRRYGFQHAWEIPEPRVGRGIDGLPFGLDGWPDDWEEGISRVVTAKGRAHNEKLMALGNAVVPQQIYPIFKEIALLNSLEIIGNLRNR